MKIIEGTPQEITEYITKRNQENSFSNKSDSLKKEQTKGYGFSFLQREIIKNEYHWSNSKQQWVPIKDMNETYIINVLRKKLNDNRAVNLMEDDEFLSLVVTLSDKIVEAK
jgi:hypothetical protein